MDGFQATAAIRQLEPSTAQDRTSPDVPIIALTAHATRGFEERCLAAGMDAYLSKPFEAARLIELIERFAWRPTAPARKEPAPTPSAVPAQRDPPCKPGNSNRASLAAPVRSGPASRANTIDYETALERLDGKHELFADLTSFFLDDAPDYLNSIRQGLTEANSGRVKIAAHSLKGLTSQLEALAARDAAWAVEEAAKAEDLERAAELLSELEACIEELTHTLRAMQLSSDSAGRCSQAASHRVR
jgi:CheY-like chemotaxis protein